MGAAENESFRHFVSTEQPGLLRLAILLAGDRGHAEDLVQIALMKSYRHWARISRTGTPSAYVRRVLVTSHTSWRRRLVTSRLTRLPSPSRARATAAAANNVKIHAVIRHGAIARLHREPLTLGTSLRPSRGGYS